MLGCSQLRRQPVQAALLVGGLAAPDPDALALPDAAQERFKVIAGTGEHLQSGVCGIGRITAGQQAQSFQTFPAEAVRAVVGQ